MKFGPIHKLRTIKGAMNPEHIFKILKMHNTICGENCEYSRVQVSF
jgi:hypothetical protein